MTGRITFAVAAGEASRSGGYLYVRRVADALAHQGADAAVESIAGDSPLPDEDARIAACRLLRQMPDGNAVVIDIGALPAFAPAVDERRRGVALLGLVHHPLSLETGLEEAEAQRLREMESEVLCRLDRVIVTSRHTGGMVEALGVPAARIGVVTPGTDQAGWRHQANGDWEAPVNVLCVGPVTPRKGQRCLVAALARLCDLDWHLACVGSTERDPDYAAAARSDAEAAGIAGRVRFLGEVDDAALDREYRRADLLALPSALEGYGMVLAEALARGIPVAATDYGPIPDFVPREASILAPVGNAESLSKALRRVIFDAELRSRMAEAAWQAGQSLPTWDKAAAAFHAELARTEAAT